MRKACLLSFAAILAGVGLSTTSYAATEPQAGVYVMSGVVTKVTASGGAACVAAGAAIKGYSYFPVQQTRGMISRSSSRRSARRQVLFILFHQ